MSVEYSISEREALIAFNFQTLSVIPFDYSITPSLISHLCEFIATFRVPFVVSSVEEKKKQQTPNGFTLLHRHVNLLYLCLQILHSWKDCPKWLPISAGNYVDSFLLCFCKLATKCTDVFVYVMHRACAGVCPCVYVCVFVCVFVCSCVLRVFDVCLCVCRTCEKKIISLIFWGFCYVVDILLHFFLHVQSCVFLRSSGKDSCVPCSRPSMPSRSIKSTVNTTKCKISFSWKS